MEIKKIPAADLERKRRLFFFFGLIISSALFLIILNFPLHYDKSEFDSDSFDKFLQDLELQQEDEENLVPMLQQTKKQTHEIINDAEFSEVIDNEILNTSTNIYESNNNITSKEEEEIDVLEPSITDNNNEILSWRVVEELPSFPGGLTEFMKWLTNELKYPEVAYKQKIEGTVEISFIVNKDGSISDIKLEKSVHNLLNEEALRVINSMPNWEAGKDKGEACRTLIALPIVFKI